MILKEKQMLYSFMVWFLGMPIVDLILAFLTMIGIIMPPLLAVVAGSVGLLFLVYCILIAYSPAFAAAHAAVILFALINSTIM